MAIRTRTPVRATPADIRRPSGGLRRFWRRHGVPYLFITPMVLFACLFVWYPLLRALQLVFMKYEFLTGDPPRFIGLGNIVRWFGDPRVAETLWVTIKFTLMYVPASTILALAVAILMDRVKNPLAASAYRTIFYFPVVLPASIVFFMWKWMYDPTLGLFNQVFQSLHIPWPWPGWISDYHVALPALAFMSIWRLMGATMMLFLVGLNNIPRDLYSAARIDGAGEWQVARRITLPLLMPALFMILTLRLQVLGLAVEPLIMTEGGPVRSTTTYGLQAYNLMFRDDNWSMGYGSTWFLMLGLISAILAWILYKYLRPEVE